jgi:hypothetical protein
MKGKAILGKSIYLFLLFQVLSGQILLGKTNFSENSIKYGGGSGEPNDPFLIYTAEQMNTIGTEPNDWNKHFKLMADIDLSQYTGTQYNIIGTSYNSAFIGFFDGNNCTISNFNYSCTDKNYIGLFGYFRKYGNSSLIKDLRLIDPNVNAQNGDSIGAIIGYGSNARLTGCYVEGGKVYGKDDVGGLIGRDYEMDISSCYSDADVQGEDSCGGLAGWAYHGQLNQCGSNSTVSGHRYVGCLAGTSSAKVDFCFSSGSVLGDISVGGLVGSVGGTMTSCYSSSSVESTEGYAGGLVGYNSGTIKSCYSLGEVLGNDIVGGLAGYNSSTISHCYSNSYFQGNSNVAGLVGDNNYQILFSYSTGHVVGNKNTSALTNGGLTYLCYWDMETSGVDGNGVGIGKTTEQMKNASTYRGWGYGNCWVLDDGNDYPHLIWEDTSGQLLVDLPRTYGGGTGEPNNPYQINTIEQFTSIAYYPDDYSKHFIIIDNLDFETVSQNDIIPIGIQNFPFTGLLNGGMKTISNFLYNAGSSDDVGLFGYIGNGGIVENVRLIDVAVTGKDCVGGISGYNLGTIRNCSVTGYIYGNDEIGGITGVNEGSVFQCHVSMNIEGNNRVGGVAGYSSYNQGGSIIDCSSTGQITGNNYVGGLIGYIYGGKKEIKSSFSTADVIGAENVGGLVGICRNGYYAMPRMGFPPGYISVSNLSYVSSCYYAGTVQGNKCVGGLIGKNEGLVTFCYSAAQVKGIKSVKNSRDGSVIEEPITIGGLIGDNSIGSVLLSYWDTEISEQLFSSAGKGKTTRQMKSSSTYKGWAYENQWVIDEGNDYPRLSWEGLDGEILTDDMIRYSNGTGEPNDPYIIQTDEDFLDIAYYPEDWDKSFILSEDIDLNNIDPNLIQPIGGFGLPFVGVFDGGNHTISNFRCLSEKQSFIGVFGGIGPYIFDNEPAPILKEPNSAVRNLHIKDAYITGYYCAGGLAGYSNGTITNCSVTGDVNAIHENVGGIAGYNLGEIIDCNTQCNITSKRIAGALTGYNNGPITNCHSSGIVGSSSGYYMGGLVGDNCNVVEFCHFNGSVTGNELTGGLIGLNTGDIINCSVEGDITGSLYTGGLVGKNEARINASFSNSIIIGKKYVGGLVGNNVNKIINCYATGSIEGEQYVAGLAGGGSNMDVSYCYSSCIITGQQDLFGLLVNAYSYSKIKSCFWDAELCDLNDGVGNLVPDPETVSGLSTIQMQTKSTFTNAGWDFVGENENGDEDIWWINDGKSYPVLWWELVPPG